MRLANPRAKFIAELATQIHAARVSDHENFDPDPSKSIEDARQIVDIVEGQQGDIFEPEEDEE